MNVRAPIASLALSVTFAALLVGCAGSQSAVDRQVQAEARCDDDGRVVAQSGITAVHREMLSNLERRVLAEGAGFTTCFAPGTSSEVMDAFNERLFPESPAFNQASRWAATALDPAGGTVGTPTTITYSFVPDGTPVDGFAGEPAAPSQLFADLNAIYGSPEVWQPLFHSVFARWGQLIGVHYVYEPNDDGVAIASADGVAGVRADVRIAGHPIDGNSGILAYNFFPQTGDMVIETSDNFFAQTFADSVRLRNVVSHEHGHGMGQAHVCPINQTKLMEPFISVAYDGPREDDIRSGQLFYGDPFEPNNSAAEAHDLGTLASTGTLTIGAPPAPAVPFTSLLSIDAVGATDWFKVTIATPTVLSATATPIGRTYEDAQQACSGQSGSCCSGTFTNSSAAADLAIRILASDGTTIVANASANAAGLAEVATATASPGVYFIQVYETGVTAPPQMYNLTIDSQSAAFTPSLVSGPPLAIAPGAMTTLDVLVTPGQQTLNVGASSLRYRASAGGAFSSAPLAALGGNVYRATLPAFACGAAPEYFFELVGSAGSSLTLPATAPTANFTSFVGEITTVFADDMEIDRGWTVGPTTASTGAWERVDPNGTAAAPEDDNTPGSGVTCWVTGQGAPGGGLGDQDVDGGLTTLVSPVIDLSAGGEVTIAYARWYSNGTGGAPFADTFRVEVSADDGATWLAAETVGPGGPADPNTNPSWISTSFTLASLGVAATAQMRIRFIAEDVPTGSVIEAGVDDVMIIRRSCAAPSCPADFNGDGDLNPDDLADYIGAFFAQPPAQGSDFNNDGTTDPDDLADFIGAFFGGC